MRRPKRVSYMSMGAAGLAIAVLWAGFGWSQATEALPDWQKAAGGKMEFEVASIRLAKPDTFTPPNIALNIDNDSIPPGGRFFADFSLMVYIDFAYKIMPTQEQQSAMLAGLPQWVKTDHFVIEAKAAGDPTKDQMRLMVQSLLADRFKLKVHFETHVEPVLALVLDKPGKLGPRLRPHSEGLSCDAKWTPPPDPLSKSVPPGGDTPVCGTFPVRFEPHYTFLLGARDVTMQRIALYVPAWQDVGRPVVDETGLKGTYDFSLYSTPDRNDAATPNANAQIDPDAPTFSEALKEQLGLKLKPEKAPIQVLVIDHAEQPSPN